MKKILLSENEKKTMLSEREKLIVEQFAHTFNKIKRVNEDTLSIDELTKNFAKRAYNAANQELGDMDSNSDALGVRKRQIQMGKFSRYINPDIQAAAVKLKVGLEAPSEDIILVYLSTEGSERPDSFQSAEICLSVNASGYQVKKGDITQMPSNYMRAIGVLVKKIVADFQDKPTDTKTNTLESVNVKKKR